MLKYVNFDVVFREIPDEVTLAINLSQCPNRCKGCHSPALWGDIGTPLSKEFLDSLLKEYGKAITCVCFMGGDIDPRCVMYWAQYIHEQEIAKVKFGWYSGKRDLPKDFCIDYFDYIKLGPYIEERGALDKTTTNQHLYQIQKGEMKDITHLFWKK